MAQSTFPAAFDEIDLRLESGLAARSVPSKGFVPLHEAPADVVEAFDDLGERLVEVGQLSLETADSYSSLAGKLKGVGHIVGHAVRDEHADRPGDGGAGDGP